MFRKASLALVPASLLSLSGILAAGDSEFWCPEDDSLPGVRVQYHSGKQWPLEPRPCAPKEPCIHRYHTAHYWPDPYRWQDRVSVRMHAAAQAAAGWTTNTTLYEQHFDPETNELNEAGYVHLRWILLYAPPQRRMPWVQAGDTPQISEIRLASAQAAASAISGGAACPVSLRVCQPYGGSAQEVDLVRRAYLSSIPNPRISYIPQNGSSTGAANTGNVNPNPQGSR
jgi:hypothetical protein